MAHLRDFMPSYPAVAELTRQLDQEKIEILTKRVDDLRNENQELKNKIFKSENDTHEFMTYFQKEIGTKDGTISKLNDELLLRESEMRVEAKNVLEKAQRNLADVNDKMAALEKELSGRIKTLEGELASLVRFRELRDFHDKAMKDMAASMEAKEQTHVQEMHHLERKFIVIKGNLQKDLEHVIEDVKRQSRIEAYNSLGAETKNVDEKNKQMVKDLRFHKKMTTELQAHAEALEERMANAWRENAIMQDRDKEYAREGQAKNNEVSRTTGDKTLTLSQ